MTRTVTTPANGAGQITYVQRAKFYRSATDFELETKTWSSNGMYFIDNLPTSFRVGSDLEQGAGNAIGSVGNNATKKHYFNDSPGSGLVASTNRKTVDDSFECYLMHKPTGGDSIWVSLQKVNWYWKGDAKLSTQGVWELQALGQNVKDSPKDPTGVNTTALPTWTGKKTDLTYE